MTANFHDLVDLLVAAVVPCPRVPLAVLVGHDGAERVVDRLGREVLRGNQDQAVPLTHLQRSFTSSGCGATRAKKDGIFKNGCTVKARERLAVSGLNPASRVYPIRRAVRVGCVCGRDGENGSAIEVSQ